MKRTRLYQRPADQKMNDLDLADEIALLEKRVVVASVVVKEAYRITTHIAEAESEVDL